MIIAVGFVGNTKIIEYDSAATLSFVEGLLVLPVYSSPKVSVEQLYSIINKVPDWATKYVPK